MAVPLLLLAIGAVVAGYVGVPAELGGVNRIETFLEPSFVVSEVRLKPVTTTALPATTVVEEAVPA